MYTMCVRVCSFEYVCAHVHIHDVIVSMQACECVCLLSIYYSAYTTQHILYTYPGCTLHTLYTVKYIFIWVKGGES